MTSGFSGLSFNAYLLDTSAIRSKSGRLPGTWASNFGYCVSSYWTRDLDMWADSRPKHPAYSQVICQVKRVRELSQGLVITIDSPNEESCGLVKGSTIIHVIRYKYKLLQHRRPSISRRLPRSQLQLSVVSGGRGSNVSFFGNYLQGTHLPYSESDHRSVRQITLAERNLYGRRVLRLLVGCSLRCRGRVRLVLFGDLVSLRLGHGERW